MAVPKSSVLVLDCAEPEELADFYAALLNAEVRVGPQSETLEVVGQAGVRLAIRKDHGFAPPSWPRPDDSQQAHLLLLVAREDMDEAEREAVGLGARPLDTKNNGGVRDARLYSDPAGHPFTLATSG
ncbi:VOC family protein [Streptomyces sp. NPDC001743]|uniref:VOC family protein n=1 Tax=Streptomyces sp. NPDC001743 TaxID=3154397 RepID=UPI00332462E1